MNRTVEKPKYSDKYYDSEYEYRYVTLPRNLTDSIIEVRNQGKYLTEEQARELGIVQSRGWMHYDYHIPEPHILLFKRPLGTNPRTGKVDSELKAKFFALQAKKSFVTALISS